MRIFTLLLCLTMLLFASCKTEVERVVEGWWTMDTIYYKDYDLRACLGNSLNFKIDGESELPTAKNYCEPAVKNNYEKWANIEIVKSSNAKDTIPLRIKIITNNEVFAGTHKIVFYKDELNKLLKMEMWSDSLYIVCRKGLFNFDKNIPLINKLEKMSWLTRPELLNKKYLNHH